MNVPVWMQAITDLALAVIVGILGFYQWLSKKSQVNAIQIKEMERDFGRQLKAQRDDVGELRELLAGLTERLRSSEQHAPDRNDLKRLHRRIDDQSQCVSRMEGELHAVRGTVQLIHEYLLNREKS